MLHYWNNTAYFSLYLNENINLIVSIIGIIVPTITILIYFSDRFKNKNRYFSTIWKNSRKLTGKEILGERWFGNVYYERLFDEEIIDKLKNGENLFIIGRSLSGKSRAIFNALTKLDRSYDVLVPKCNNIDPEKFEIPRNWKFWRSRLVIIDDLHRFVEQQNFDLLFKELYKSNYIVLAASRSGGELKKVIDMFLKNGIDFNSYFNENFLEIPNVSDNEKKDIILRYHFDEKKVAQFDHSIGSLFMPLAEMERRFNNCTQEEKSILNTVRQCYLCGVYQENQYVPLIWIKKVIEHKKIIFSDIQWNQYLENLCDKEFFSIENQRIKFEEVYYEKIVKSPINNSLEDDFNCLLPVFLTLAEPLIRMAGKAQNLSLTHERKPEFTKIAIYSYEGALKLVGQEKLHTKYAMTYYNLGIAYFSLAEVENNPENYKNCINSFRKALESLIPQDYPIQYIITQNCLGIAYQAIAKNENKSENYKASIKALRKALEIYSPDKISGLTQLKKPFTPKIVFPGLTARESVMIGALFDGKEPCSMAEASARAELSLGRSGFPLERIDKPLSEMNVIELRRIQLARIISKQSKTTMNVYPIDYAITTFNLGIAYQGLAEIEKDPENYKNCINAFQEVLKIYTPDNYPLQHAKTQIQLGIAYQALAEIEEKPMNLKKSIGAFQNALDIYTFDKFTIDNITMKNYLISVIKLCEDKI